MDFTALFEEEGQVEMSDFFGEVDTGKKKKAAQKKAATKPVAARKGKSSGSDFDVTLPVTVFARGFSMNLDGAGVIKASECLKRIFDEGYHEVALDGVNCFYEQALNHLYITYDSLYPDAEDSCVNIPEEGIIISDGMNKCVITISDFHGYDADEISVDMLIEKWEENNPRYSGFGLCVCENIAYPISRNFLVEKDKISLPCEVLVNGEWICVDEDDFLSPDDEITVADLIKKFLGTVEGIEMKVMANADHSCYFTSYKQKTNKSVKKGITPVSKGTKEKVEKKFVLPVHVRLCNMGGELWQLTSESFNGKEKVTLDEVKSFFAARYKAFNDKTRKVDAVYLEEANLLSLMIVSGEKGSYAAGASYELLRTNEELEKALKLDFFHGTLVNHAISSEPIRVENLSNGIYLATTDGKSGNVLSLEYRRKLPLIPKSFLNSIIENFKKDLEKEAMVKILYNKTSGEFVMVRPKVRATKISVNYEMPPELLTNINLVHVMDIHSHNTMPAFFSSIDNRDEIFPGLYGVIGKLDKENPEMKFRAGFEGVFQNLELKDIFTEE